jgi:hypothetical protein
MTLSGQHYLFAVAIALLAGLVAAGGFGLWRRGRIEARAGIGALCAMKWRDYAHLVEDLLRERGFRRGDEARRPGDGGFDLMMERGSARYLVDCKNGGTHHITEQAVHDLAALMEMHGAEGAVLATTGVADTAALQLAANRRIEILAGPSLWQQIKPWLPHDLRDEIARNARGAHTKRAALSVAVALVCGVLALAIAPMLQREPVTKTPPAAIEATPPLTPAATPARAPTPAAPFPEVPDLTPDQLASRRASAVMEVRGMPSVANAAWSTQSTFVVTLHRARTEVPAEFFDDICRRLLQYEEMRFTRLQVETQGAPGEAVVPVRWRQCR